MRLFAIIFCFYLTALMALPSVRVIKMQLSETCKSSSCDNNDFESGCCEKGKIIMSLSFTPVNYLQSKLYKAPVKTVVITSKKEKIYYQENLISKYQNSIWQPPKIIS
ncbi:hypothetical protein [Flavobacterium terrigena]|uniref:Uncharacterized protein n=1 Tax=Flavobacterium terrigena TaxID=402734 RepID=A0A1H6Q6X3_9FLAO|nr:hypothetical protein [Flavobacterium terrigena]SEI39523.1 hypothetical protein SAMN05660918_0321 [Flavobacterium terrigena]